MWSTKTRHTCGGPVFGRLVLGCERCEELMEGAVVRSWGGRREDDARRARWIRAHRCEASGCGPVCTFGEW